MPAMVTATVVMLTVAGRGYSRWQDGSSIILCCSIDQRVRGKSCAIILARRSVTGDSDLGTENTVVGIPIPSVSEADEGDHGSSH